MAPIGSVGEQSQCDLGDPRLVGRVGVYLYADDKPISSLSLLHRILLNSGTLPGMAVSPSPHPLVRWQLSLSPPSLVASSSDVLIVLVYICMQMISPEVGRKIRLK